MPHLLFRNVDVEEVEKISAECTQILANICDCEMSDFTFELIHATSFIGGKVAEGDKTVEVMMFDRGLEARKNIVNVLYEVLKQDYHGYVTITFSNQEKDEYFENGQHF